VPSRAVVHQRTSTIRRDAGLFERKAAVKLNVSHIYNDDVLRVCSFDNATVWPLCGSTSGNKLPCDRAESSCACRDARLIDAVRMQ